MADIELVIKIPEEIYEASQIIDVKYEDTIQIPLEVIASGTPLPKHHGRLIDYDDLIEKLDRYGRGNVKYQLPYSPTIIEADRAESEE